MCNRYLTDEEVAELLGIGVPELRKKLCRGEELPPSCKLPGMRKRLWFTSSVDEWIRKFEVDGYSMPHDLKDATDTWSKYQ